MVHVATAVKEVGVIEDTLGSAALKVNIAYPYTISSTQYNLTSIMYTVHILCD